MPLIMTGKMFPFNQGLRRIAFLAETIPMEINRNRKYTDNIDLRFPNNNYKELMDDCSKKNCFVLEFFIIRIFFSFIVVGLGMVGFKIARYIFMCGHMSDKCKGKHLN